MASLADAALDAAIGYIITNGTHLSLCSAEPANYAGIAAVELAEDATVTCGAAANGASNGRRTTVPATACVASASGDATVWALHNNSSILVATGALADTIEISNGLTYNAGSFDITVADAQQAA